MYGYSDKRNLVYWSRLYLEQFKSGIKYERANKTICIWILDGEVYDFPKYHSMWKIAEAENGESGNFDEFEIHVIELQKLRKESIMKPRRKEFWLWFIDHTKKELVEMAYSLEEIRKAKAEYEKMLEGNEALQHLLMREEMAEMDEENRRYLAEKEGMEKGLEEGKRKAKYEDAKKMLEKGLDIELIQDITGLSREEIENIKMAE